MRLGRTFRPFSRRFGAITSPAEAAPVNLTWGAATATVAMVAPTLRIDYTPVPTATTSALIAVPPVLSESYVVPAATATVDGVNEVTSFTYAVPAATATVAMPDVGISIVTTLNLTWDTATATVAMVLPVLRLSYTTPPATTSALIAVAPTFSSTYTTPAALTSALIAVPPVLSHTFAVSPATATIAAVLPGLSHRYVVPAATASVTGGSMDITRPAPAAEASVAMVAPTLRISLPIQITNLIHNGGFETNTTGHTASGATLTRVTSEAKYGAASVKMEGLGGTFGLFTDTGNLLNPGSAVGEKYTASAWVKGEGSTIGKLFRVVAREHPNGGPDSTGTIALTGDWQRITVTHTITRADTTWLRVFVLSNYATPPAGDIAYVDGIQLEHAPMAQDYVETNGGIASAPSQAEADVAGVAETTRLSYVTAPATANATLIAPTLSISYATPAASTSALIAVAPALSHTYAIPTAISSAMVIIAPTLVLTYGVPAATATVAMPDVGISVGSGNVNVTWETATANAELVLPALRITYAVPAETATAAAVNPALNVTVGINSGTVSGAGVAPNTVFTFGVPTATATAAMPDVGFAVVKNYISDPATATVTLVAPALSITLGVPSGTVSGQVVTPVVSYTLGVPASTASGIAVPPVTRLTFTVTPATASVAMPDVALQTGGDVTLLVSSATATVSMADVGISIVPVGPVTPTPGASGGQLLEFVFNDLDLKVEPATAFVQMVPPILKTYRQVKRRIPVIRPQPVFEEISFEERLWEIQPKEQPQVVFSTRPLQHHFFEVTPQHMFLAQVPPVERKLYGFDSPLWGRYRRRTAKEELHEMILLGILD